MHLPFLHKQVAGLYLDGIQLTWAEVTTFRNRVEHVDIVHYETGDQPLAEALAVLRSRLSEPLPAVCTHVKPEHVRHVLCQGPALDDAHLFEEWLRAQTYRQLPQSASTDDFLIRHRVLEAEEENTRVLLTLVRREVVDEHLRTLTEAGFEVASIGSIEAELEALLLLQPGFGDGLTAVLLTRSDEATVLRYRDGRLTGVHPFAFDPSEEAWPSLLRQLKTHLTPSEMGSTINRLLVLGLAAEPLAELAKTHQLIDGPIHALQPTDLVPGSGTQNKDLPAVALPLPLLAGAFSTLNFLNPEVARPAQQAQEKRDAQRVLVATGAFALVLVVLLLGLSAYLSSAYATTEEELLRLADQVTEVEQARTALAYLEEEVIQAEHLVIERTQLARVLHWVGQAVPDYLWLDELAVQPSPEGGPHLIIIGTAFGETEVATYLDTLEQASHVRNARLVYAETQERSVLYRHELHRPRPLTHFEIRLDLASRLLSTASEH